MSQPYELPEARRKSRIARLAKVDALYRSGASVPEMCAATGATKPTIYSDLRDLGHRTPDGWTAEARERQATKTAIIHARRRQQKKKPVRCSVKGCKADAVDRFKGAWYCPECLLAAGDHDPDYEERQRVAVLEGFQECALARAPELGGDARHENPRGLGQMLDRAMEKRGIPRQTPNPNLWLRRVPEDFTPYKEGIQ